MTGIKARSGPQAADALFGPQLPGYFDFTLRFEHTILTILPNAVFLVGSLICIKHLVSQPRHVHRGILWWLKLVTSALLLAADACALTLWCLTAVPTSFSIAAASTSCLTSLFVIILADVEHQRSLHSSGWLSSYLGIHMLLCFAKARSLFLRAELQSLAILQLISIVFTLVLLVLGEVSKANEVVDSQQRLAAGAEVFAGFWNRSCFFWALPTLYAGSQRLLHIHDLGHIEGDLQGNWLFPQFASIWSRQDKASSRPLFKVLLQAMIRPMLLAMMPRLALTGFSFAQPYLLERVVLLLESDDRKRDIKNGLVGAAALIYIGITISRTWYNYLVARMATKTRSILASAVFNKTLKLEHEQAKKLAAVTLMSTDTDGIARNVRTLYEFMANLLELAVGIGLLAARVGLACILLLVPTALLSIVSVKYGRKVAPSQIAWNKSIEDRVSKTSAILRQIRPIKMAGQGPAAIDYIQKLRETEIEASTKYRFLQAALFANAMLIYCLTPISVMAGSMFWTRSGDDALKPSNVFTILAIVAVVSTPLSRVVAFYPGVAATFGRLKRIEMFLSLAERCDQRTFAESESGEKGSSSTEFEKHDGPKTYDGFSGNDNVHPLDAHQLRISATTNSDAIIRSSSFYVPRRKFTMLVGKTGHGKSLLLRGLLGEAIITQGSISLGRKLVAYCDSEVWVQNLSIRSNIVGACAYDAPWYGCVLRACQLLQDIQALPAGDESMVGTDGLKLSGGQKARLLFFVKALARAVYALAPLILLDDVLSCLDAATADAIINQLVGPQGVLRRTDCAVVLASSSGKYLPMADHLLFLDDSRNIVMVPNRNYIPGYAKLLGEEPTAGRAEPGQAQAAAPEVQADQPATSLHKDDDPEQFLQHGDTSLYLVYFKSIPRKLLLFWASLLCGFALSERSPEIYMRIWLAMFPTNKLFFIGYSLLGVSCGVLGLSQTYIFWLKVTPKASENLHKAFLDVVMNATYQFITSIDAGFLLNRFGGDMTIIGQELPNAIALVIYDVFLVMIDIGIISAGAKYMALTIPIIFFLLFFLQKFYLRTSRQLRFMDLEARSPLYTHFTETARGLLHIRGFQWETHFTAKFYKLLADSQKPNYHLLVIQQWLTASMDCIGMVLGITLVAFALAFGDGSPSGTGLALLNLITFSEQLTFLMNDWTGLETSLGAIARLDQFVKNTPTERDADDVPPVSPSWPENGTIEFRGVDSGYGNSRDDNRLILNRLSLSVPGGSKLGVIGQTGCGKTTMLLTLLNLLEHRGSLLIDGIDITEVPRQILRTRITTVSQDMFELPGTLRDNLLPPEIMRPLSANRRLDDEAIHNVLLVVGLTDIVNTRGGLNAPFDELGFSHGERQLVALARGIIHTLEFRTKIVLMDEATGVLDNDTLATIKAVIDGYFVNHTVITIAHRMDAVRNANKVYDMTTNRVYH